jgi:hypothetical protein
LRGSTNRPGAAVNAAALMTVTKLTAATHQAGWIRGVRGRGADGGADAPPASGTGVLICVTASVCSGGATGDSDRKVTVR